MYGKLPINNFFFSKKVAKSVQQSTYTKALRISSRTQQNLWRYHSPFTSSHCQVSAWTIISTFFSCLALFENGTTIKIIMVLSRKGAFPECSTLQMITATVDNRRSDRHSTASTSTCLTRFNHLWTTSEPAVSRNARSSNDKKSEICIT